MEHGYAEHEYMNWGLVVTLSGFGLLMGLATITLIPSTAEPVFWLVIFGICAYVIARRAGSRFFLHGLALGVVNSVWITGAHELFFDTYLAHHPQEAAMTASMPFGDTPRIAMLIVGPVIGVISGVVIGLLGMLAARLTRGARVSPARSH